MFWQLFEMFAAYALMIIILWAGAASAVQSMLKSRSGRQSTKRHGKLYVRTIQPKGGFVK